MDCVGTRDHLYRIPIVFTFDDIPSIFRAPYQNGILYHCFLRNPSGATFLSARHDSTNEQILDWRRFSLIGFFVKKNIFFLVAPCDIPPKRNFVTIIIIYLRNGSWLVCGFHILKPQNAGRYTYHKIYYNVLSIFATLTNISVISPVVPTTQNIQL